MDRSGATDNKKPQILAAAVETFMQKGVAHTSMNDIVRASGMSKGGVYHYFASKDELLVGVLEDFQEQHINYLNLFPEGELSHYEKVRYLITGHRDLLDQMGKYNLMFIDLFAHSARIPVLKAAFNKSYEDFHTVLEMMIGQGIQQGEFKADVNPGAFASGLIGIFDGIGAGFMVAPKKVDYPNHSMEAALYMLDGIRKV